MRNPRIDRMKAMRFIVVFRFSLGVAIPSANPSNRLPAPVGRPPTGTNSSRCMMDDHDVVHASPDELPVIDIHAF
mgnify:CR=1 FL=1